MKATDATYLRAWKKEIAEGVDIGTLTMTDRTHADVRISAAQVISGETAR